MRKNVPASFILIAVSALLNGCNCAGNDKLNIQSAQPAQAAAAAEAEVMKTMDAYFLEGLKRPFGPGGPRFELPASYYKYFASHLSSATQYLDDKLVSAQGIEKANSYDIIIHMGQYSVSREWALSKMKQAIDNDDPVKFMFLSTYERESGDK